MKKWMCVLLAGVLLLSLTACKKQNAGETGSTESAGQQMTENTQTTKQETGEDILADLRQYPVLYELCCL